MKHATIPFPRQFGPGASGIDCRAVKRALAVALGGPEGMSLATGTFAQPAQIALVKFKQKHGLLNDPIYTLEAHTKLTPSFDAYGASLMAKAALAYAAKRQRATFVDTFDWMIAHHGLNDYREVRPIPLHLKPFETSTRIVTDCSGAIVLAAKWSNLPDPSKLGYDGAGNTGTFLAACTHITAQQALPGDLIVYRRGAGDLYGHHAVAVLSVIGAHADFEVFSNGHQGDPGRYLHSAMAAEQARDFGATFPTFLRFLPAY